MPTDVGYRPALDGLRAVAIALVLIMHAGYLLVGSDYGGVLPGGFIGVDLFFVLSGFLITAILLAERERTGAISIPRFYLRRALRLFPAVVFLLAVFLPYELVTGGPGGDLRTSAKSVVFIGGYAANWAIIHGVALSPGLAHMWSLAIEEQFYLVWPLLLVALLAICGGRRRVVLAIVIAAAALSAVWRGVLSGHVAGWPILYLRTDTRADALLVGAALALSVSSGRRLPRWTAAAGTIGAIVILAVARFAHREDLFLYRGGLVIVALGSAALIAACLDTDWWLPAALAWPPIVLVGQLSYSLYLWHFPVFSVVADQGRDLPTAIRVFVGLAITFAIAGVSRRYVEMPFLRLKQKGARPLAASHVR